MKYIIYKLTSPSGKVYIGRTDDFERRMIEHKHRITKQARWPIYKAAKKYGWDNIIKEIIDTADTLEDCVTKELEYILKYDSMKNGYNSTYNTKDGGDVWLGRKDTDEYKKFVEKMSTIASGVNNGMFGKNHSEEAKNKQKEKAKGRFSLDWYIEKYGSEQGKIMHKERSENLKKRVMQRDERGIFIKKEKGQ
jgi:group I intron endonuclease